jgi:hypothetical protein
MAPMVGVLVEGGKHVFVVSTSNHFLLMLLSDKGSFHSALLLSKAGA